jgi:hypothetical protein
MSARHLGKYQGFDNRYVIISNFKEPNLVKGKATPGVWGDMNISK